MTSVTRRYFPWLLLTVALSCSSYRSKELVGLPEAGGNDMLDSTQAGVVLRYAQDYPNETQISLAFIVGDSERFVGIMRRNDSLVYIRNSDQAFEIGSITKTFTATILAKLVHEGKIRLDEPIKNILPVKLHQSAREGKEVTLRHLANHTSGFPREPDNVSTDWALPGSPYKDYDTSMLYDYLSNRLTLQFTPGEKREYSNLGGGLLGHVLTIATGKGYEDLLTESICKPLGLHRTFVVLDSRRRAYLVPGRDPQGNVIPNWELNVSVGSGGIKSTAQDMAKYLRAHLTDTTYYFLTQQPTIDYTEQNSAGLGWVWWKNGSRKYVSQTGGTWGYSCCAFFERSTRTGIVLLTNVSSFLAGKGESLTQMGIELHGSLLRDVRSN